MVIGVWLVLAAGLTVVSHSIGRDTSDNLSIPGSGANAAKDVLNDSLPQQANGTNPVVFKAKKGRSTAAPTSRRWTRRSTR